MKRGHGRQWALTTPSYLACVNVPFVLDPGDFSGPGKYSRPASRLAKKVRRKNDRVPRQYNQLGPCSTQTNHLRTTINELQKPQH